MGIAFGGTACLWDPRVGFRQRRNLFGKQPEDSLRGNLQTPISHSFLLCTCYVLGRHVLVVGGTCMSRMEIGHASTEFVVGSREGRRRGLFPFHSGGSWDHNNGKLLDQ